MRQAKRRNNKRSFAGGLFYSMSLKVHLLFQTFALWQLFLLRWPIMHHAGHVLRVYLPSASKPYFDEIRCNRRWVACFLSSTCFAPSPRWTPLKLYQQTINGGACNLLPLFSSSNVLQTPEVVTGREIFCKWHLAKGQIQGPSGWKVE